MAPDKPEKQSEQPKERAKEAVDKLSANREFIAQENFPKEYKDFFFNENNKARQFFITSVDQLNRKEITFGQLINEMDLKSYMPAIALSLTYQNWNFDHRLGNRFRDFLKHYKEYKLTLAAKHDRHKLADKSSPFDLSTAIPDTSGMLDLMQMDAAFSKAYHSTLDVFKKSEEEKIANFTVVASSSAVNDKWRLYFEENIRGAQQKMLALHKNYSDKDLKKGDAFDYLVSFKEELSKIAVQIEKLQEQANKTGEMQANAQKRHDNEILALANKSMARKFLERKIKPLEDFFKTATHAMSFKVTFENLKDHYLNEDDGVFGDTEYVFVHPLRTIGSHMLSSMAAEGSQSQSRWSDNETINGSKSIAEILKNYESTFFPGLVAKAEEEFGDLQMKMFLAGLNVPLPQKFRTRPDNIVDNIKRTAKTYELIRNKNFSAVRRYIKDRAMHRDYIESAIDAHSAGGSLEKIKNAAVYLAELSQLQSQYDGFEAKWLNPTSGIFADNANIDNPKDGVYKVMQALDEAEATFGPKARELWNRIGEDEESNEINREMDGYPFAGYYASINHLNDQHLIVFKALFPDYKPQATPTPTQPSSAPLQ